MAFTSVADNRVFGDANDSADVFVRDILAGTTTRGSVTSSGTEVNSNSTGPSLSDDGRYVAFTSAADNLVIGVFNAQFDVFLRDTWTPRVTFCSGDGSGKTCPCGNQGAPGSGCASSVNHSGAYLSAGGVVSLSADSLRLSASGMPDSFALYFQGT